jgi:hypothetical protein
MAKKTTGALGIVGVGFVALHILAARADLEQYKINLKRWQASPTLANLIKLALAEGVLIKDLGWLV